MHILKRGRCELVIPVLLASFLIGAPGTGWSEGDPQAVLRLGEKLFGEAQLSNPGSEYAASCGSCHAFGDDPQGRGPRFYADSVPRSLLPSGLRAKGTTLRNTPTLLGVSQMTRLGHDGRFASLEELVREKLGGRHMGWGTGDRERAYDAIHATLLAEEGYAGTFKEAYGADLESAGRDEVIEWTVRSLADFVRAIRSSRTAPWDAFIAMNRINPGPNEGESPQHYGGRIHGRLANQEARQLVKRPKGFSRLAYEGFKTFFRVEGPSSVGNCVACHTPPEFTDFQFHNTGVAEVEYDRVHGRGSFRKLEIPGPDAAQRPSERFLAIPAADKPSYADLGHWNFVDVGDSTLRREGEATEAFLGRMVGTFKTPGLRNLLQTDPYMHNGAFATIEEGVAEIVRINAMARAGELREIDEEYRTMNLSEEDIAPLAAFLRVIDDVGERDFRELLMTLAED